MEEQLRNTIIERWVKQVGLLEDPENQWSSKSYNLGELHEQVQKIQLAKRSRPSYNWQEDIQGKWWRIWFQEENLTIQIDLHFSDGRYQMNMSEIDLEECTNSSLFLASLYRVTLRKQWSCPEMLWAIMEISDEISQKLFEKQIAETYLTNKELKWES